MERNEALVLDDILYHLYDNGSFHDLERRFLEKLRMLIRYSYASFLLINNSDDMPVFSDPVCFPDEIMEMEEQYIKIAGEDHTIWNTDRNGVICESMLLSDEKRLAAPVYRDCYSRWNIYDTLQVTIAYRGISLGILTLYRTRGDGAFHDEDIFYMNIIAHHLNRLFYRALISERPEDRRRELTASLRKQYSLTQREEEILFHLFSGISDDEIAAMLQISPATLKKHLQHIYRKLDISTRWELMKFRA